LLNKGAKVVIADLDLQKAQQVADQISNDHKVKTLAVKMNFTNKNQVNIAIDKIVDTFDCIDTIVNNAGIQIISPIVNFKVTAWQKISDIHMTGTLMITQAAIMLNLAL
jgi:3-hydroxybutyrate dehydrogenase